MGEVNLNLARSVVQALCHRSSPVEMFRLKLIIISIGSGPTNIDQAHLETMLGTREMGKT